MSDSFFRKVVVLGDSYGLPSLLRSIPPDEICCIVAAKIRPLDIAAVAKLANDAGVPLLIQPSFSEREYSDFFAQLKKFNPDLLLCNSYSMLVRQDVLDLVKRNALNVHASLLPRNRGPNPLQWALIKGEVKTGITLHFMKEGIDTGDIVAQVILDIGQEDTWGDLKIKTTYAMQPILKSQIPSILANKFVRNPQNEYLSTTNTRLNENSPRIDFSKMTDFEIYNLIRAHVAPLKGAYIESGKGRIYLPNFVPRSKIAELRSEYA